MKKGLKLDYYTLVRSYLAQASYRPSLMKKGLKHEGSLGVPAMVYAQVGYRPSLMKKGLKRTMNQYIRNPPCALLQAFPDEEGIETRIASVRQCPRNTALQAFPDEEGIETDQ